MKVKKLALNKETIAHLGSHAMRNAHGGALPQTKETECMCLTGTCTDSVNCNPPMLTMPVCRPTMIMQHCFDNSDTCGTVDIFQCHTDISFCPYETDCGCVGTL